MKSDNDVLSCSVEPAFCSTDPPSLELTVPGCGPCLHTPSVCALPLRSSVPCYRTELGGVSTPLCLWHLHLTLLLHLTFIICTWNVLTPSRGVLWVRFFDETLELFGFQRGCCDKHQLFPSHQQQQFSPVGGISHKEPSPES